MSSSLSKERETGDALLSALGAGGPTNLAILAAVFSIGRAALLVDAGFEEGKGGATCAYAPTPLGKAAGASPLALGGDAGAPLYPPTFVGGATGASRGLATCSTSALGGAALVAVGVVFGKGFA